MATAVSPYPAAPLPQHASDESDVVEGYVGDKVPSTFIQPEGYRPSSLLSNRGDEIPVIDMEGLLSNETRADTLRQIHEACLEWGFFQVINHGVPNTVIQAMKQKTEEFLSLPLHERAPAGVKKGAAGQGYRSGYVQPETGSRDWRDFYVLRTFPLSQRDTNLWPNNAEFREVMNTYCEEMRKLQVKLLACLSENLGLGASYLEEALGELHQDLMINHYPPCPEPELVVGASSHTDLGAVTALLQTEDVIGLQIWKDGEWVPVRPLPSAYIINVADQVEIASNGIYKSVQHRAVVTTGKKRISIAAFYDLHPDVVVQPASQLVSEERPPLYKPTRFAEHAYKLAIETDKIGATAN